MTVTRVGPVMSHSDQTHRVRTRRLLQAHETRRKSSSMTNLDRNHPFSWYRCIVSIISYALLVSDVLRTGPAIRQFPKDFGLLEPDGIVSFGPVGYPTYHLTHENATTQTSSPFWPYKYDTTSVSMRALAQHLQASSWSPCVLYQERCDESQGLPLLTVFTMIDSLVGAIQGNTSQHQSINLRINSLFRDNLHHYVMPWFFEYTVKRTIQAVYYDSERAQRLHSNLCNSMNEQRPYSCSQLWTNRLNAACTQTRSECRVARTVRQQIPKRIDMLSRLYPDTIADVVVIDSLEDSTQAGVAFHGQQRADIVLLSRIRSCVNAICRTVAVDDYRFETMLLTTNVKDWFNTVALLRVMGQAYTWLRLLLLLWICHISRHDASFQYRLSSRLTQCRTVIRTIFLVPSQVVVYGSLFPISMYYIAHLIDSPASYAIVYIKFTSLLGSITWNVTDVAHYCAVSMRAVWVLSFYCHAVQAAFTKCVWSSSVGIPGVSEFVITLIASLTLFGQYRMLILRNSAVLDIFEVVRSARMHQIRSYPQDGSRTVLFKLLFGQTIDLKCLIQAAILVALLCGAMLSLNRTFPREFPYLVSITSRTLVPYSAGYLWPKNRLVVSWFGSFVTRASFQSITAPSNGPKDQAQVPELNMVALPHATGGFEQHSTTPLNAEGRRFLLRSNSTFSHQVQQEMLRASLRSRGTESVIYLMNFAVMTDPITLLRLRYFSAHQVEMHESKVSQQCFLLPTNVRLSKADIGIEWEELQLVALANTKDLQWDDLLRCG